MRIGLGYVREVRQDAAERLVAEREAGGPFRDLADLAARADLRREQLAQLVAPGPATRSSAPGGRCSGSSACWPARAGGAPGTQLALPFPAAPLRRSPS